MMGLFERLEQMGRKAHDLDATPPFYDANLMPRALAFGGKESAYLSANVVMSPVMWIMRLIVEAHAIVQSRRAAAQPKEEEQPKEKPAWEHSADHAAEILLDEPNPFYDGDILLQATIASFAPCGNAFWKKIRNSEGQVIQLWYLPHWLVKPKYPTDGSRYIDHYEYRSGIGEPEKIATRDIVHFRFGLDPRDPRMGLGPLGTILREVMTDEEASVFSAAILHNMGVPGLVLSPKDKTARPSPTDVDETKKYMQSQEFRGSGRGTALVFGTPMEIAQFGFDPNKLMLGSLRDISEERVCASLGLPAAVVGFGSGMQSTKVGATMRELVKMSWVGCLSPLTKSLAKQGTRQLLPDFVSQRRRFRIRFDTSEVSGFQEDENQLTDRVVKVTQGGILRVDRAQAALGLEVDPTQKIYLRPSNSMPIDEKGNPITDAAPEGSAAGEDDDEEIPPAVAARLSGNGTEPEEEEEE
jgi:HK97 family phage portal protein